MCVSLQARLSRFVKIRVLAKSSSLVYALGYLALPILVHFLVIEVAKGTVRVVGY